MTSYRAIVILTGAGISAESGLATFREAGGLWERYRIEDVATPEAYARDPQMVQRFYNARRRQLLDPAVQPNAAHRALAELEQRYEGSVWLITQNIDNLHERAGSQRVIHMHGELLKLRCTRRDTVYPAEQDVSLEDRCRCCAPPASLRPHIVWFGEMPMALAQIGQLLSRCDLFVAIGTSGQVYPAAGFVQEARSAGAHTVELNLEPSAAGAFFLEQRYGPASQIVPPFVQQLLS